MSKASIQTSPDPQPVVTPMPPADGLPKRKVRRYRPAYRALKLLASLKLTVVLFVLSLILVFVGTLAQMDAGIWNVVNTYFWSICVWVPFQVFARFGQVFFGVDPKTLLPGSFPFPGGKLLGAALLLNLLAAHLVRFKLSWKRSGILMIHGGLILMMVGEFITREFAIEGNMTIFENGNATFVEQHDKCELAFTSHASDTMDNVVVVPGSKLKKPAESISDDQLPVEVKVEQFMLNSQLGAVAGTPLFRELLQRRDGALKYMAPPADKLPPAAEHPATAGLGADLFALRKREGVGVDTEAKFDFPSAYITFADKKTGQDLGTYLLSTWISVLGLPEQKITVDGQTYEVALRYKRANKPYTMHLIKVSTTYYPGTETAKDYHSQVRLVDPRFNEDRTVTILMNQPLRYQGETFYQASVIGSNGTVLQVVRNPGWLLPYISCIMVGLGMLIHFTMNLSTFLNRRAMP